MLTLQKSEFREETNFPRTPPYISVIVNGLEEESKLEKTINLRRIKIDGETTWCGTKGRVAPGKICALERAPLGIRPRINGGFYDSSFIHRSNYNGVSQTHRDIVAIKTDFQWEKKSGGGGDVQCHNQNYESNYGIKWSKVKDSNHYNRRNGRFHSSSKTHQMQRAQVSWPIRMWFRCRRVKKK